MEGKHKNKRSEYLSTETLKGWHVILEPPVAQVGQQMAEKYVL